MNTWSNAFSHKRDETFRRLAVVPTCLYLTGLALNEFPPLIFELGNTTVLRPGWLLTIPVVGYTLIRRKLLVTPVTLVSVAFLIVAILSILVNPVVAPTTFLTMFGQLIYGVGLLFLFSSLEFSTEEMRTILRFWIVLLVSVALFGIAQAVIINAFQIRTDWALLRGFRAGAGYIRPSSIFQEPSFLGDTLVTGIAVLLPCVVNGGTVLFTRRGRTIAGAIIVAGLLVSGSIGGYITLALGLGAVWLIIPDIRGSLQESFIVIAPVVAVVVGIVELVSGLLIATIMARLKHFADILAGVPRGGSIAVRYMVYVIQFKIWVQEPLFGVGLGQYRQRASAYLAEVHELSNLTVYDVSMLVTGQNGSWTSVLAHTGLAGLVTFLVIWGNALRTQVGVAADKNGVEKTLLQSGVCVTVFLLIDWSFTYSFVHPSRWALVGLTYGYAVSLND